MGEKQNNEVSEKNLYNLYCGTQVLISTSTSQNHGRDNFTGAAQALRLLKSLSWLDNQDV